jgi:hypothetical protein
MKLSLLSKLTQVRVLKAQRCRYRHSDGRACKATGQRGREYCFFHDPEQREKRLAANRTGGAHSRRRKPKAAFNRLETRAQLGVFLRQLMNDVRNGDVSSRRANTLARLTPLVIGVMEKEDEQVEREKYEVWVRAEAERLAARERLAAASRAEKSFAWMPELNVDTDPQAAVKLKARTVVETLNSALSSALNIAPLETTAAAEAYTPEPATSEPAASELAAVADDDSEPEHEKTRPDDRDRAEEEEPEEPVLKIERENYQNEQAPGFLRAQDSSTPTDAKAARVGEPGVSRATDGGGRWGPLGCTAQAVSVPMRDPDYEPSPIPGLQNRHLNYLKYAGMQGVGFVSRRR